MAYSWGYEDFDWSEEGGQDIPEEIEKLVIKAVDELFHNVPADNDQDRVSGGQGGWHPDRGWYCTQYV